MTKNNKKIQEILSEDISEEDALDMLENMSERLTHITERAIGETTAATILKKIMIDIRPNINNIMKMIRSDIIYYDINYDNDIDKTEDTKILMLSMLDSISKVIIEVTFFLEKLDQNVKLVSNFGSFIDLFKKERLTEFFIGIGMNFNKIFNGNEKEKDEFFLYIENIYTNCLSKILGTMGGLYVRYEYNNEIKDMNDFSKLMETIIRRKLIKLIHILIDNDSCIEMQEALINIEEAMLSMMDLLIGNILINKKNNTVIIKTLEKEKEIIRVMITVSRNIYINIEENIYKNLNESDEESE